MLVKQLKERYSQRRWMIEKTWWGAILFHLGLQWIAYDPMARRYRHRKLSPSIPTPVTNLFRATIDTVKSAISQHQPRFIGIPERDDPRSVASASSADAQLQVILKEGRFQHARQRMMDWLMLTGNGFIEVLWDNSEETGQDLIPYEQCTACRQPFSPEELDATNPICPNCGNRSFIEDEQVGELVTRGSIRFDSKSPFEVYMDPAIEDLSQQSSLLLIESYTKEQVQQTWSYSVEESARGGATGMQRMSAMADSGIPGISTTNPLETAHRVTVVRAFIRHHAKYPDGAYIVMTSGGKLLEKTTPYPWRRRNRGRSYFPIIHYRFGTVGGRAWGYSPAEDLLPKQYQLNKAESLLTLITTRMANPVWLIPTTTNPTRITGEIGIQIEYTPTGGTKPERVPGADAPASLVKYITDIRQSFDELSGAFSAVRGRTMGTRTPVGTVQQLTDRGFGRWATVFEGLEAGYEDLAKVGLEVWRQNAKTPRVRAVQNAIGGWTFQEFLSADWDDGVDVSVEAGSSRPTTQNQKLQTYMQLAQAGLIQLSDQAQVIKILEDVGMTNLLPGVEEDTKAAYGENAEYMRWASSVSKALLQAPNMSDPTQQAAIQQTLANIPIQVTPLVDEHALHYLTHRRLCLTEEFKMLPVPIQEVMFAHMMQHKMDVLASKVFNQPPPITQPGVKPVQPPREG